jgi:hypothetical protein
MFRCERECLLLGGKRKCYYAEYDFPLWVVSLCEKKEMPTIFIFLALQVKKEGRIRFFLISRNVLKLWPCTYAMKNMFRLDRVDRKKLVFM